MNFWFLVLLSVYFDKRLLQMLWLPGYNASLEECLEFFASFFCQSRVHICFDCQVFQCETWGMPPNFCFWFFFFVLLGETSLYLLWLPGPSQKNNGFLISTCSIKESASGILITRMHVNCDQPCNEVRVQENQFVKTDFHTSLVSLAGSFY